MNEYLNFDIFSKQFRYNINSEKEYQWLRKNFSDTSSAEHYIQNAVSNFGRDRNYETRLDKLLKYYSLVSIAALSEYFPSEIIVGLDEEVYPILKNELINNFYEKKQYALPQLLLMQIEIPYLNDFIADMGYERNIFSDNDWEKERFEEFLIFSKFYQDDEEFDVFIDFLYTRIPFRSLDWVDKVGIMYKHKLRTYYTSNLNSLKDCVYFGMVKFSQFISTLADILRRTEKSPVLQSSFWHYYRMYFDNDFLQHSFSIRVDELLHQMKENNMTAEYDLSEHSSILSKADNLYPEVFNIIEDFEFLTQPHLKEPVLTIINRSKEIEIGELDLDDR